MAYRRPIFRPQIGDPTTSLDSYICTLESGAMALDIETNGRVQVWGGQLVPYCGRTAADIREKGTRLQNVDQAWAHWGENLSIRTGGDWGDVLNALEEGRWIILQGDYDQFSLSTRCQDSFLGDHAVLIGPEISGGNIIMADPLCKDFKFVPPLELRNYAQKLGRRIYNTLGWDWRGEIYFGVTKSQIPLPPDTSTGDTDMAEAIAAGGLTLSSNYCVPLPVGTQLYKANNVPLTKVSVAQTADYMGQADGYYFVVVRTGALYADGKIRPTQAMVKPSTTVKVRVKTATELLGTAARYGGGSSGADLELKVAFNQGVSEAAAKALTAKKP